MSDGKYNTLRVALQLEGETGGGKGRVLKENAFSGV
jgi:hypothetical protein